ATSLERINAGSGSGPKSSVPSVNSVAPGAGNSSSFTAPSALSASTSMQFGPSNARRGLVAGLALAGGAALAVVFWVMTRGHATDPPAAAVTAATTQAPAPPPAASDIDLRVSASPAE